MDKNWLQTLDHTAHVIVPTRSLGNELSQQLTHLQISSNKSVWTSPKISTWSDFLQQLFEYNRQTLAAFFGIHKLSFIDSQQGRLLWTHVIEGSKREEQSLALLNVQQSAKAAQRSWRLVNDWMVPLKTLQDAHIEDSVQFALWCEAYQLLLQERGLMDEQTLLKGLLDISQSKIIRVGKQRLELYAFDLVTANQKALIRTIESQGAVFKQRPIDLKERQNLGFYQYESNKTELSAVFNKARQILQDDPSARINVVVPQLQQYNALLREVAAEVFYPATPPLALQNNDLVYRFSLGEPLAQWPAVQAALSVIGVLKGRVSISEFGFLLRNRFLRRCRTESLQLGLFLSWLRYHRISEIEVSNLVVLAEQFLNIGEEPLSDEQTNLLEFIHEIVKFHRGLDQLLATKKQEVGYASLSFSQWAQQFTDCLALWGWSTSVANESYSSVQFQLAERWLGLLSEFHALSLAQSACGLSRSIEIVVQMARDSVFLPKAADSPIFISGIFEAIGRPVDHCFVTNTDDSYPEPVKLQPFVGHQLKQNEDYPSADNARELSQAKAVINSLFASADNIHISYSRSDESDANISRGPSALFRKENFIEFKQDNEKPRQEVCLHGYSDIRGLALPNATLAKGGSKIFEDQSNCAFRAFATHRLGFSSDDDPEFGLDHLDRGTITHAILERVWEVLGNQSTLIEKTENGQIESVVSDAIAVVYQKLEAGEGQVKLTQEKQSLLQLEAKRLAVTILEWLSHDMARPIPFAVVSREEPASGEVGGIRFRYSIDRIDVLDDGRSVIVDYKTGQVDKKDWKGPRIRKPQLPLYHIANSNQKQQASSGIAYGQIKRYSSQYVELAEQGIFKRQPSHALKTEELWKESSGSWEGIFDDLADQFLAGEAAVNPIDEQSCAHCELQPMCRVSQLRSQTKPTTADAESVPS